MRQCPTCECFVPAAATRCPRCEAELVPIHKPIEGADASRLVAVGSGSGAVWHAATGAANGASTPHLGDRIGDHDPAPPVDAPSARVQLPPLPKPFAPDPVEVAAYLGIPRVVATLESITSYAPPGLASAPAPAAAPAVATQPAPAPVVAPAPVAPQPAAEPEPEPEPRSQAATALVLAAIAAALPTEPVEELALPPIDEPPAGAEAETENRDAPLDAVARAFPPPVAALPSEPIEELALPPIEEPAPIPFPLPPDTFSALLGDPPPVEIPAIARPVAQPAPRPTPAPPAPAPTPIPAAPVAHAPIIGPLKVEPIAAATPVAGLRPVQLPKSKLSVRLRERRRHDPFARRTSRRERMLMRACVTLVLALLATIAVLRLPVGARPELGATIPTAGASSATVAPAPGTDDALRIQSTADLQVAINTANEVFIIWHTYAIVSPAALNRTAPQLSFTALKVTSRRLGSISVASNAHRIVFAEYAGAGRCAFARAVDGHTGAIAFTTNNGICRAFSPPTHGWATLSPAA